MGACADYLRAKGRRLSFEWALIDGINDRRTDARELADLARALPLPAHVNLIPLNPTPGYPTRGTPPDGVRRFRQLARRPGRQRHGPPQPRHRHRRRLRPAARPGSSWAAARPAVSAPAR